ncbi:acylphosphatase [Rothia sp. LK2588]|uniref:acylphosphatase n=1 Tax=Rothia sp. LK2588 TaxID=3114369 RepID=UPI0034CD89DE
MGLFSRDSNPRGSQPHGAGQTPDAQLNAVVHGHVQGVGFRYWTKGEATPLGLTGYAKNLDDGTVEVLAQGTREACQQLLDALNSGNTAGRVDHVDAEIVEPGETRGGFETL